MKIKTTALVITVPLIFIALSKGENIRKSLKQGENIRQEQNDFSSQVRASKEQVKKAKRLSEVALARVKVCTPTVVPGLKANNYYKAGDPVVDNHKRPLGEGRIICNELGETALVGPNSTMTDVASVSTDDFDRFMKDFNKRKYGAVSNGKSNKQSK